MYLRRVKIKNYRSISDLSIAFEKGKNVIVGKNNAGKSNVIKAIDLILGESSPTYFKSENITENDFHNGVTDEPIYIFCELFREKGEKLNFNQIYNCLGYKFHAETRNYNREKSIWEGTPARHNLPIDNRNFWDNAEAILNVDEEDVLNIYVNPKLRHQHTFEEQLDKHYRFAFLFRATHDGKKISKEIRFLYRENDSADWILSFTAPIRNEFIQSAIIPSFRDPASILRINQWSWFGKLLKCYIDPNNPKLVKAFDQVREASEEVFESLKAEINNSKIKVAFPKTDISFQFNPDTKMDVYKSALIYVNDGFNSLLQEKGSGIQSAIIIGLFHYYTRNISHSSGSLLAIEEPEIYLHPQARRVISNRLDDFLEGGENQVIITTHSTEFISTAHENLNIIHVSRDPSSASVARNTKFVDSKEKQILLKTQNSEMFFADKVILVEGGDKYILEALSHYYGETVVPSLGKNWLNDQNISVISVGGKTEFWKYFKKLKELNLTCYILADFDFFLSQLNEFFTNLAVKGRWIDELNEIKGNIGIIEPSNKRIILDEISLFCEKLKKGGVEINESSIRKEIKQKFRVKKLDQIPNDNHPAIITYLEKLKEKSVFILTAELEDYFSEECDDLTKKVNGKEEKVIYIVSQLISPEKKIVELVQPDEFFSLFDSLLKSE